MASARVKRAAGRCSPVVCKHGAPFGQHGLLDVVLRHRAADFLKMRFNAAKRRLVQIKRFAEKGGDGLLCQIVRRRTEPSDGYNDVRACARDFKHAAQPLRVVADDGMVVDADAHLRQFFGHKARVCIRCLAEEELRTHGNNFRCHKIFLSLIPDRRQACPPRRKKAGRAAARTERALALPP